MSSILYSNARAPVSQLVRASGRSSEDPGSNPGWISISFFTMLYWILFAFLSCGFTAVVTCLLNYLLLNIMPYCSSYIHPYCSSYIHSSVWTKLSKTATLLSEFHYFWTISSKGWQNGNQNCLLSMETGFVIHRFWELFSKFVSQCFR